MLLATTGFGWLFLPSFVHFPNGYDLHVKRDPPRFAEPVDRDNVVSIDLPGGVDGTTLPRTQCAEGAYE